jgi:hypothetical protein
MDIDGAKKSVGKKYTKLDSNGDASGCFSPIPLVHPEFKYKFEYPNMDVVTKDCILPLLKQYCYEIDLKDLEQGDILALNMPFGWFHLGVYIGNGDVLHCTQENGMEIVKLSRLEKRIEGGFRIKWDL